MWWLFGIISADVVVVVVVVVVWIVKITTQMIHDHFVTIDTNIIIYMRMVVFVSIYM